MTGARKTHSMRYTRAGNTAWEEQKGKLYIATDPAGSPRENLRDLNRGAYRDANHQSPTPVFEQDGFKTRTKRVVRVEKTQKKQSFGAFLLAERKQDSMAFALCVVLLCTILTLMVMNGITSYTIADVQKRIDSDRAVAASIGMENESLQSEIRQAEDGERIRSLAQNKLHMLRPERAQNEVIYIQMPTIVSAETVQQSDGLHMEWLDVLLGLLNVFHIGE